LAAARTGDLEKFVPDAGGGHAGRTQRQDPTALWRQTYPDSDGVEILAILIRILETEPVRVEAGTPPEMYVWPYLARLPIKSLTPGAEGRVVPGRPRRRLPGHRGRDRAPTAPGVISSPASALRPTGKASVD